MDLRIPLHEPGQQSLPLQELGRELKRRQPKRRFEHKVVERHEPDLRRQVPWSRYQLLVRVHQRLIKDLPKCVRDALAPTSHVLRDPRRVCDHLVLKAGIELHVPRLIDLLGR